MYETVSYTCFMPIDPAPRSRMSPERRAELFSTVHELLLEVGYERLTFDAVASRARTSKATLYRQWGSKAGLVMAALTHDDAQHRPLFDDAAAATSLEEAFTQLVQEDRVSDRDLRMGVMLLHAATTDPAFAAELRTVIIAPIVDQFVAVFEAAADRGEIRRDPPLFQRLGYLILTDLAFFPLISGQPGSAAARHDLFRTIVRPALDFIDHHDD